MKIQQLKFEPDNGWLYTSESSIKPQLILAFGSRYLVEESKNIDFLRQEYPTSQVVFASTAGEIWESRVIDDSIIATAIELEKTEIQISLQNIKDNSTAYECGRNLYRSLESDELVHVLVISDGQLINGSELVDGLNHHNSKEIPITGGLAGDGSNFIKTTVGLDDNDKTGNVIAIGFYGKNFKVGHGYKGGWDAFGPEREVTKSDRNVLYELDGQSALQLYKKYLGPLSDELPGSALLFPLLLRLPHSEETLVRTVLTIDEVNNSMTYAGNLPQGAKVQLMKANFERVIEGASTAANDSLITINNATPNFALLISCVGRRLVLNQRSDEEIEETKNVLGENTIIAGFYSYGEISPLLNSTECELHNQTMTITTYRED